MILVNFYYFKSMFRFLNKLLVVDNFFSLWNWVLRFYYLEFDLDDYFAAIFGFFRCNELSYYVLPSISFSNVLFNVDFFS